MPSRQFVREDAKGHNVRLTHFDGQALLELHPSAQACAALASTLPAFVAVLASAVASEDMVQGLLELCLSS